MSRPKIMMYDTYNQNKELTAKDVLQNLERKAAAAEQDGLLGDNP